MTAAVDSCDRDGELAFYEVPEASMGIGASLGNTRGWVTTGSDGRLDNLFSTDRGRIVAGPVIVRYATGGADVTGEDVDGDSPSVPLSADAAGHFEIHPEYQRHRFTLPGGLSVAETIRLPQGPLGSSEDLCAAYYVVEVENASQRRHSLDVYGMADLAGGRRQEPVTAWYDAAQPGFVATRQAEDDPEGHWIFGATDEPFGYWLTTDRAWLYEAERLPRLNPARAEAGQPEIHGEAFGILGLRLRLEPGTRQRFAFVLTFSPEGPRQAKSLYQQQRDLAASLDRSSAYYRDRLGDCQIATPDPAINNGALWAKVNMLRVLANYPQGQAFTNEPGVSSNVVVRDVAWFIYGCDHFMPEASRNLVNALVRCQGSDGKMPEYYNAITGQSEDYELNISDPNPLFILAVNHHVRSTGDFAYLRSIYDQVKAAANYILTQRDERGLVFCTATSVKEHGIASWRNVLPGGRISGAVTEINAECAAALRAMGHLAENIDKPQTEADYFRDQAEALTQAIQSHLLDRVRQLYLLNLGTDGQAHRDVTADELFPVLFRVAEEDTAYHIIRRLTSADFWTSAGLRTASRLDPHYQPTLDVGLLGGVWPGITWWFAFAAARYYPELMVQALRISFEHYRINPRMHQTVPGQFSEWFDGQSLINRGMRLSPWEAPRFMWAAVEGVGGLMIAPGSPSLHPLRPADWDWTAVRRFWYHGQRMTFFTIRRQDQIHAYSTVDLDPDSQCKTQTFDEDVTDRVRVGHTGLHVMGFADAQRYVIAVGSCRDQAIVTPIDLSALLDTQRPYKLSQLSSELDEWRDGQTRKGKAFDAFGVRVAGKGYYLLELRW